MKNLILILVIFFLFNGCSRSYGRINLKQNDILENSYISFNPPSGKWGGYKKSKYFTYKKIIYLHSYPKGATYDIELQTYPFKWMSIDILFDKDGNYEARRKYLKNTPETLAQNKEQGISYDKGETLYLKNMKCLGSVFSRNHGGTLYSATAKNYSITCGYYDKTETENYGRRILRVEYKYSYANNKSRLQKDVNLKKEELLTKQQAEDGLKQAVRELVKTIKIKNFDNERMHKEGLMHYDKEFESTKW